MAVANMTFYSERDKNMDEKYDHKFCCNLDMNLGRIIADALKAYDKEAGAITPGWFAEQFGMAEGNKRWHKTLHRMIWSFEEAANGHKNAPDFHKLSEEEYRTQMDAYEKRVHRGRFLFAEHFGDLWI